MKIELSKMEVAIIKNALAIACKHYAQLATNEKTWITDRVTFANKGMNAQTVLNGLKLKERE